MALNKDCGNSFTKVNTWTILSLYTFAYSICLHKVLFLYLYLFTLLASEVLTIQDPGSPSLLSTDG